MRFYLTTDNWIVLTADNEVICKVALRDFEKRFGFRQASEFARWFR